MQTETERKVLLSGQVFLYRTKAPFVPSGKSVLGALEYDDTNDTVRCHECGEWFKHVGIHVNHSHDMSAREYKDKHGLKLKSALCSEGTRNHNRTAAMMVDLASKARAKWQDPEWRAKVLAGVSRANRTTPKRDTVETKNETGRCHAQIMHRLQTLAAQLGHTPSQTELRGAGISPDTLFMNFNVRNMTAVMSIVGMVPNTKGRLRYTRPVLIELMRDFYAKHHRFPSKSDYRRGLLPDQNCIFQQFGSMRACYEACGLWEEYKRYREAVASKRALAIWNSRDQATRDARMAILNAGRQAAKERGVNMGRRPSSVSATGD